MSPGHSSDSEDLSAMDSSNKLTPVKHSSLPKSQKLSRSPGLVSPNSKDMEKDKHKEKQSVPSPRTYKWSCQLRVSKLSPGSPESANLTRHTRNFQAGMLRQVVAKLCRTLALHD
ncbi:hypothetical protein M9458_034386 [Cirrhinus mrigala]|uniref:Uncharacterized protein n=1 Tax=Cirrhinus mrigala TaxID=683832 RepID=A0ABD0P7A6_CIRMR